MCPEPRGPTLAKLADEGKNTTEKSTAAAAICTVPSAFGARGKPGCCMRLLEKQARGKRKCRLILTTKGTQH